MSLKEMQQREEETLGLLRSIALPKSFEYLETNEKAARFIAGALVAYKDAMLSGDEYRFDNKLEAYCKGWTRVWTLMAKEHYKTRAIEDVDMRYYRHLPSSYSFVMKDTTLGFDVLVVPRNPPKSTTMKWVSAATLIKMHESPIMMQTLKTFPGSWFGKESKQVDALERAIEDDKRNVVKKLKHDRTDKHGFEWYK